MMHNATATQLANAETVLTELLSAMRAYSAADPSIPLTLENLLRLHLMTGQPERAVEDAEACRKVVSDCNRGPIALARACNNLAVAYRAANRVNESRQAFAEARNHAQQANGNDTLKIEALIRFNRGIFQASQQQWAEAEQDLKTSLGISDKLLGPHHATIGDLANNIGVAAYFQHHYDEALALFKRALAVWELALGSAHSRVALGQFNLAALHRTQGFFSEAEWWFQQGLRIQEDRRRQVVSTFYEPFFSNLLEAPRPSWRPWLGPEVGLLHPVDIYDDPLAIDLPDGMERLPVYNAQVQGLREDRNVEVLKETIQKLGPWYHNLEITPGLSTNPPMGGHPMSRWQILEPFVPKDLSGKTVLDIGCNAGYFSLQMKKRRASRVVSIDIMPQFLAQARFISAWEDAPLEIRQMDTYDVESLGSFDYVVFVGVLYHLKHPLYALEKIANVCTDTLLFQSVVRGPEGDFNPKEDYPESEASIFDLPEYPKMYFVEKLFNGDVSNWWFANQSCLKAMIRTAGFREIISTAREDTFICRK